MTTITESDVTQAIQYLEGMIGGNVIDIPDVKRAVAVLSTAARFALEASQRLATESGDSVAWALKMAVQNGSIQLTPLDFRGWDNGCDCAECEQQRAVYGWLFGAVNDENL